MIEMALVFLGGLAVGAVLHRAWVQACLADEREAQRDASFPWEA